MVEEVSDEDHVDSDDEKLAKEVLLQKEEHKSDER